MTKNISLVHTLSHARSLLRYSVDDEKNMICGNLNIVYLTISGPAIYCET